MVQVSTFGHEEKQALGLARQGTALVHEAYLKLVDQRQVRWQDRTHFFAVAA